MCVAVSLLQQLCDLWQEVGGVARAQQVQKHLTAVLVTDHLRQRRDDLLQWGKSIIGGEAGSGSIGQNKFDIQSKSNYSLRFF